MEIDLHGYHPAEVVFNGVLGKILQEAWEMGEHELTLIHGHGRNRGVTPGFVNTNTGYFGLCIRRALRQEQSFRQWILHTTLDCRQIGLHFDQTKTELEPDQKTTGLPLGVLRLREAIAGNSASLSGYPCELTRSWRQWVPAETAGRHLVGYWKENKVNIPCC